MTHRPTAPRDPLPAAVPSPGGAAVAGACRRVGRRTADGTGRSRPVPRRASRMIAAAREALPGLAGAAFLAFAMYMLRAMIRPGLFWAGEGFTLCLIALGLVRLAEGLAGARAGTAPVTGWQVKPDARQFLDAFVHGDGIPALEAAALEEATALYGPGARLEVARMSQVDTSCLTSKGRFCAHVLVRCLDFEEEGQ